MDPFYYEIVATDAGMDAAARVRQLIGGHADLSQTAEAWARPGLPVHADLYVLIAIATADLADDPEIVRRVAHASAGGFPVVPVVERIAHYDFQSAPIDEIADRNAEELAQPERLLRTLLHHGGLALFEGGGHVFVSYARADGSELAEAIRQQLIEAQVGVTVDLYAFAGGVSIQDEIERRIEESDLVIAIDSRGASKSEWVAEEIDIALSARTPIVAVVPTIGGFVHMAQTPHVEWSGDASAAPKVLAAARQILARKAAFGTRVERILRRLSRLKEWTMQADGSRWSLRTGAGAVAIGWTEDLPMAEDVYRLDEAIRPGRGVLVGGTRPLRASNRRRLSRRGSSRVRVAALPTMASKVPSVDDETPLEGTRVFLSAAMPSDPEEVELARETLGPFLVSLTEALVDLGATLVFGGHPSVTPLIHRALKGFDKEHAGGVELHQARFWRDGTRLKPEVREGPVFRGARWHGAGRDPGADVAALRDGMIREGLDAAVFVGGKTDGFIGDRPGIVDEHERFCRACPGEPTFVVGLAGGAARQLPRPDSFALDAIRNSTDPDLTVALIIAELLRL